MKHSLPCFFLLIPLFSMAQRADSLFYTRPSIQADFDVNAQFEIPLHPVSEFSKLAPGDPFVHSDLSRFSESQMYLNLPEPRFFTLSYFKPLKSRPRLSLAVGLSYRRGLLAIHSAGTESTTKTDQYVNSEGDTLVMYETVSEFLQFIVAGHQTFIPFGIRYSGDRARRVWFEAGVDIAPGIVYGFNYRRHYSVHISQSVRPPHEVPPSQSYSGDGMSSDFKQQLKGVGPALYASIPLSVYLRLTKEKNVFGRLQLMLRVQPSYVYSQFKSLNARQAYEMRLGTGLRYNL